MRQSLLMRWSTSRILVSSLRLRIPFNRIMRRALRMPSGFLGFLPGPVVW
jgi:hypothetical protein